MTKTLLPYVSAKQKIGFQCRDGSIYAGILPDGKFMFAMPEDAPLLLDFNDAAKYIADLNAQKKLGHEDWILATKSQLESLFNNRAAIGNFDTSGIGYRSSTEDGHNYAWVREFRKGISFSNYKYNLDYHVRAIRLEN